MCAKKTKIMTLTILLLHVTLAPFWSASRRMRVLSSACKQGTAHTHLRQQHHVHVSITCRSKHICIVILRKMALGSRREELLNKVIILVFFAHKKYPRSFVKLQLNHWFTWTICRSSCLPFWTLNVVVPLQSMQGQKALAFHQKYLNLCSGDERRSYGFGTTWGGCN